MNVEKAIEHLLQLHAASEGRVDKAERQIDAMIRHPALPAGPSRGPLVDLDRLALYRRKAGVRNRLAGSQTQFASAV